MAIKYAANFALTNLKRNFECGVVYICCNCRVPIGDTNDRNGCHLGDNVIMLKVVSQYVKSGKLTTSRDPCDAGSQYQSLTCTNCNNVLGKFYSSTPAHLEHKLNMYNIDSTAVQEYIFGEDLQQIIDLAEAPITLELCCYYEEEFKKQKILLEMLLERLSKLEEEILSPEQDS